MPFEEANAQTQLMNELTQLADRVQSLLSTNTLLQDTRYGAARAKLDDTMKNLVQAQDAIGYTPRLGD
ncbi:hypothetical protein LL998_34010 (plasmid) [Burkholderia ambifaria]|uniref:hypothetical protein n=1 Tax=Burkholderia ambifaria TaxID=152480 RepID=UPI001E3606E0|nr:hypothetical protein [Burkholderia ambifaria]UEP39756.1 hypothetical protein LL998_34010 [Burkholderia ambifaria]